ncbi:MAG: phosphoenolpyruvate carboxykinase, partial [Desulfobacterales bacterium]
MGPKKDVIDIVTELGGIKTIESAQKLIEDRLDATNLSKLSLIKNQAVLQKIANAIVLCNPDSVFINTASDADRQFIRDLSIEKGEEAKLPMEGHTIHYDLKDEQGRIIDRTFYVYNEGEEVNSLAQLKDRSEVFKDVQDKMTGIMRGKIMMIGFYLRGPVGAPASNPAVEISSSTYVLHSADILYRNV